METKEFAEAKRLLEGGLCYKFREFEDKTGLEITAVKIKRNEQWIESVKVKVDVPDLPEEPRVDSQD